MGLGYTTMLYDREMLDTGLADVGACRYDGVEIGVEKLRYAGAEDVRAVLDRHDLDLYCVMAEWPISEDAVKRNCEGADLAGAAGATYYGILPPERNREDDATVERWLEAMCDAAAEAGLSPLVHHHGATHVEQPDEIERWLDRGPENLALLFDTAHYYPYGDVREGLERFADDIAYVHLKDVDPPAEFEAHAHALSSGDAHLDNVINYFRAFTDLGEGVIDFERVADTLAQVDYDGHLTIEIENRTQLPLVHAKLNFDYWTAIGGDE